MGLPSFAAFDIESLDWDRFQLAAVVTEEGDAEVVHSPEELAARLSTMQRRVYAHFGGRYDFFFLPPLQSIVMSGSGILRAQHGQALLYDSFPLMPMALKKIGKLVGMEKFENRSDRIEQLTQREVEEHAIQDTRILVEALKRHRAWCATYAERWPATAGGTSIMCAETLEPEGVAYMARQVVDLEEWFAISQAVSGGRVEVHHHGTPRCDVYAYDINSSYPASWNEAPLPLGPWRHVTHEVSGVPAVYRAHVRQSRAHLPVVAPEHAWRHDGEVWLTSEELEELRACGGTADVLEGWVSAPPQWFGREFVASLYGAKLRGDPWAKVAVNALHGKFSQGLLNETHYRQKDDSYSRDVELSLPAWYQRPGVAAFVLARARLRLWRTMETLRARGWRVFYCDTDCVHTDCPPESFPGVLSDGCGEWKREAGPCEAVYVAPKVYGLRERDGKTKLVCKGFPAKVVTWELLLSVARGAVKTETHRSGLVGFKSQGAWGAKAATLTRTLRRHTGGKHHGEEEDGTGPLTYR